MRLMYVGYVILLGNMALRMVGLGLSLEMLFETTALAFAAILVDLLREIAVAIRKKNS